MSQMAGNDTRNVQVSLSANTSGFQQAMAAAGRSTDAVLAGLEKIGRATDDLIKRSGRRMILIGTADLAALTAAGEAVNRFDMAMQNVRATSVITGQSVGALAKNVQDMATRIPDTTNNIARLTGEIQALGVQGTANITRLTELAEKLAAATNTAPGQLLSGVVQLGRQMGTSQTDIERYSSVVVDLSKNMGVAASDITNFSTSIAAVAQQAGYNEKQVLALSAAFARAGADGGQAANVFVQITGQMNQALATNSSQLTTFASIVNMTRDNFSRMAKEHPEQALQALIEALHGQGQRAIVTLQELGLDGNRAYRAVSQLASGQINLSAAMAQANNAYDKNTAVSRASAAAWHELSSNMTIFRNELTQIAMKMAGPNSVLETFFSVINKGLGIFNNFLGMLGGLPSTVLSIAGAFLIVSGVITRALIPLLAFGGAWRALGGMAGTNVMRGFTSGARGGPNAPISTIWRNRAIDMNALDENGNPVYSPWAHRWSNLGRRAGARFFRPSGVYSVRRLAGETDEEFAQRQSMAEVPDWARDYPQLRSRNMLTRGLSSIAAYPFKKVGYEAREFVDMFPHLGDYTKWSNEAVNPWSVLGMFKQAQGSGAAVNDTFSRLMTGAGDMALAGVGRVRGALGDAGVAGGQAFDWLRGVGTKAGGATAQAWEALNQQRRQAWSGNMDPAMWAAAARSKMAPLGNVLELPPEMQAWVAQTRGRVTTSAQQAAWQAKSVKDQVLSKAWGTADVLTMQVDANVAKAKEKIDAIRAEVRKVATMPVDERTAGGWMPPWMKRLSKTIPDQDLRRQTIFGNYRNIASAESDLEEGAGLSMNQRTMRLVGGVGRVGLRGASAVAGVATRGAAAAAGAVATGFGAVASAVGSVIGPLGMLAAVAIPAYEGLKAFGDRGKESADKITSAAAEFAQALGQTYKPQPYSTPQTPGAQPTPFGRTEIQTAHSSTFGRAHAQDIQRFGNMNNRRQRQAYAQTIVDRLVYGANAGAPLTTAQQQEMREFLVREVGPAEAHRMFNALDKGGSTGQEWMGRNQQLLTAAMTDAQRGINPIGGRWSGRQAQQSLGVVAEQFVNARTPEQQAAILRAASSMYASGGGVGFNALAKQIQDVYNKNAPAGQRLNISGSFNWDDLIKKLRGGDDAAKQLADDLTKASPKLGDLSKAADALAASANQAGQDTDSLAYKVSQTTLGKLLGGQVGPTAAGFDLLNPSSVNYNQGAFAYTQIAGGTNAQGRFGGVGLPTQESLTQSIAAWEQLASTINDQSNPAFKAAQQNVSDLTQALAQQRSMFMTLPQAASAYASDIGNLNLNDPTQFQQAQGDLGAAENNYYQGVQQLKGYYLQWREANRQQEYAQADHNTQLQHMERDHNRQLTETWYQRNLALKQANHEFSESVRSMRYEIADAYGNPAQMVQSQFTMGADTALVGMQRQLHMLQASKQAMDQLQAMGVSQDAIRLMGLDDPKNVEQAQRYVTELAQNPALVKAWNASINNRLKISNGIATDINNSKFRDMKRQFDYTAQQATDAFNHSLTLTDQAYKTELSDFDQAYQTSVKRASDEMSRLAEDQQWSITQIMQLAATTGIKNINAYRDAVIKAAGDVQTAIGNMTAAGTAAAGGGAGGTGGGGANTSQTGQGYSGTGDRRWTGTPGSQFHRAGGKSPHAGYLFSGQSIVNDTFDPMGNKPMGWGKDVAVAPDNRRLGANAKLAQSMAKNFGWSGGPEWAALYQIWNQESGFNVHAGSVGAAYGIPQADPGNKMADTTLGGGPNWKDDATTQIRWGLNYIRERYGDPLGAWYFKDRNGWYANGGIINGRRIIGVGEAGPEMVLPLNTQGASFVAQVMEATIHRTGITRAAVSATRTAPLASTVVSGNISYHMDNSTNFSGNWTVQSNDPNEMARKLQAQKRLTALRRPVART